MPTTKTHAEEHQEQWQEIVADPILRDLPYKVETNHRGQIVLSPHTTHHARQQKRIQETLDALLDAGEAFSEWPIATAGGTKQADVIWASETRFENMEETGEPPTLAPEVCVEVMSASNDWDEMEEKIALYRDAGADKVWVVDETGRVHFFADEELEQSDRAPDFPDTL
ncbi:Uma2 family endonuclease [Salinibacter ruber]|uniref:Uma2 family endonuclease n=1 Tax=Salinibacter ruber TaxID=146919 RepID=A0A9X2Q691_9BACT|nr:Uma2 family endonuclease [Salinibacter ruber]MCS3637861.1 Uma2 family endonuclease [Salinibacter ruber]MCS3659788.1 Uma2 family endonuclease [Salinibacter ruber]MCS3706857.1 Uma2 family endonuclease [Salinibacter ruber]MCS3709373.1 Uma2 family endonuclease [Salinibacter ruber]MCS4097686.1 Uma2 family endonuclease [Salinibacter ruber]